MLDRAQRLEPGPARPETLPIGPEEYFVLSRVSGSATVAELVASSGLPGDRALAILQRLVDVGALVLVAGPRDRLPTGATPHAMAGIPAAPKTHPTPPPGARLKDRLRATLAAVAPVGDDAGAPSPTRRPTSTAIPVAEPEPAPTPEPDPVIDPVADTDLRLNPRLAIPLTDQRWLLALADRLATLSPFEVLGIHATDDAREIKRGYFETSRRLHPDAYHGRELGNFRELLSRLFARAKGAYGELRDAKVRAPYVHARQAVLAEREGERARMQAERAAVREAERAARAQAEHHEREREAERVRQMQAERMRAQAGHARRRISEEVAIHVADAEAAEAAGNLPRAANHLRLALQVDPHDAALNERWQRVRGRARSERAKVAFARANTLSEMGQSAEALPLLVEAAEADPTAEYLAHAADGLRTVDVARARDFAIRALEALQQGLSDPTCTWDPAHVVRWRVLIGRAFLSAGQIQTAREQARLAAAMRPDDREVKALLGALARAPR